MKYIHVLFQYTRQKYQVSRRTRYDVKTFYTISRYSEHFTKKKNVFSIFKTHFPGMKYKTFHGQFRALIKIIKQRPVLGNFKLPHVHC